jgi:hypothetical protein
MILKKKIIVEISKFKKIELTRLMENLILDHVRINSEMQILNLMKIIL